jgi:hypothetical protein
MGPDASLRKPFSMSTLLDTFTDLAGPERRA